MPEKQIFEFLRKTSRSFYVVIMNLPEELRDIICVFYLVLRGLDTIEDDMSIPLPLKLEVLRNFEHLISQKGWSFHGNSPDEKDAHLLKEFFVVIDAFLGFDEKYKVIVQDITREMGNGMAYYAERKVESIKDYNLYCHYVAGLVGIGLSRLFAASGLEDASIANCIAQSNSMGLFLQKVNIIRDYKEDLDGDRSFYPKEIWSQYANDLNEFQLDENKQNALNCLNHLCYDVILQITDSLDYMSKLKTSSIFEFCAIPQVMAIATLALIFDNYRVFQGNVKISRMLTLQLVKQSKDIHSVKALFKRFLGDIRKKCHQGHPYYLKIKILSERVDDWIRKHDIEHPPPPLSIGWLGWSGIALGVVVFGAAGFWIKRRF